MSPWEFVIPSYLVKLKAGCEELEENQDDHTTTESKICLIENKIDSWKLQASA